MTDPILIVGAGPTGLTAALELSRFGLPVRLIDQHDGPATTSRAIGIQARTLELMEQRGLADEMVRLGNAASGASVYGGGQRVFRLDYAHYVQSRYNYMLFLSQAETERILREALKHLGVEPEWRTALLGIAQDGLSQAPSPVQATLSTPGKCLERIAVPWLISAEGAHSLVRSTLDLPFEGHTFDEQYALGDIHVDGDLPDSDLHIFSSEHGFMGMFPMGSGHFRLIASNPLTKPSLHSAPSLDELQRLYDQRSPIPARFYDLIWSSWFRINSRMLSTLKVGRLLLGGDAAHIHSPAGAQGMNTGIQDMVNLCWKLAMVLNGHAKQELLDTFTSDRIPVIKNVLTKTEGLTKAIGSENSLFRSAFNHLAPWLVGTDFVQRNSTEQMSQLGLNYRNSPLSENHAAPSSVKAGDRVPDLSVTLRSINGSADQKPEPATLLSLMDPSAFTLLYVNISAPSNTHAEIKRKLGSWHDLMRGHQIAAGENHQGAFKDFFGTSPSILLVRPDGYVGFAGNESSIEALAKYCDKWLVGKPASAKQEARHA